MELKLVSILGLVAMIAIAWGLSRHRKLFPWRTVFCGLSLQFLFAFLILKTEPGKQFFRWADTAFNKLNEFAAEGGRFVFGPLGSMEVTGKAFGPANAFVFAVTVTSIIILVSAISSLLYHYGILQWVVRGFAWVMQRLMRTSGSESFAAAANVFLGQTEAPLVVKPYLARMTNSEYMALMVGGMGSIAGSVLAAYVSFGVDGAILLTASVMSAPASLMIAKIMVPETEVSETSANSGIKTEKETVNGLDALCRGASEGMMLSLNVMAMLIAFVAVVAMANYLISFPQTKMGVATPVTLQTVFGWVNAPLAWLMGVPTKDCLTCGTILGERIVLNEFVAYLSLGRQKAELDPRSFQLATYALCGFANFASIAIQIGGIGALVPSRRNDLARLGLLSMIGGLLTTYLTATIVGILL